jgi:hypothetical protein
VFGRRFADVVELQTLDRIGGLQKGDRGVQIGWKGLDAAAMVSARERSPAGRNGRIFRLVARGHSSSVSFSFVRGFEWPFEPEPPKGKGGTTCVAGDSNACTFRCFGWQWSEAALNLYQKNSLSTLWFFADSV